MRHWMSCWFLLQAMPALALTLTEFNQKMDAQIKALNSQTTSGVFIQPLGNASTVLYAHNADLSLVPASATKLMTTGAAMERLGSNFTFTTSVVAFGSDLVLVGGGDPTLILADLQTIAAQIKASGFSKVASISVNASAFAEDYMGLMQFAHGSGEIDAPIVSPAAVDQNIVEIAVTPSSSGVPQLTVLPADNSYVLVQNNVRQISGASNGLAIHSLGMADTQEKIDLTGTLGSKAGTQTAYLACSSPESHIARALAALLRQVGVRVDNEYAGTSFNPLPPGGRVVATHTSARFQQVAQQYMLESINFMAEEVFQAYGSQVFGAPASLAKSQTAMHEFLIESASCSQASMVNGSGLTWDNAISVRCFVETLDKLATHSKDSFKNLIATLPIGGVSGTLKNRFRSGGPGFKASLVHAKTGTMWSQKAVSALVGLETIASGQVVLFAFIENDSRPEESLIGGFHAFEDTGVELLQSLKF